ncbi:MAG TPA: methyltransferase, partial [Acidimicrobiales bacterium]
IAVTLALRSPEAEIWAVDVNERARDLCRRNAETAGVGDRVHVVAPDDVPDGLRFDQLWSNPPIRIGKAALHQLLHEWLDRLQPDAHGLLVVSKHLGADSLTAWLNRSGHPTERLISRMAYRVLRTGPRPTLVGQEPA